MPKPDGIVPNPKATLQVGHGMANGKANASLSTKSTEEKNKPSISEQLAEMVRNRPSGTDVIKIGSGEPVEVQGATMADAAKLIDGLKYLVKGWIPFGMVTGLVAEPGVGKSAFALWLARSIVTGNDWFDGSRGPEKPGRVLWCPTENDMAITLDRIRKWGIPMDRIILPFKDDPLKPINLLDDSHLALIESLVNKYRTKAVFIDSLRGGHDGDENSSRVGKVLQGLAGIAERTKAGFEVVHHTRKLTVEEEITANSSRGSNAILAMMRSQIGFDKPDAKSPWVRVRMLKENLGLRPPAVGFQFLDDGLEFGPAPTKPRKETKKNEAEDWLRKWMEPGKWYLAKELMDAAKRFEFSENAIQRAREDIGITKAAKTIRENAEGRSEWKLTDPSLITG